MVEMVELLGNITMKAIRLSVILFAISIALVLPGCASDEAARYYGAEKYPAKGKDQVEVLYKAPEKPYMVIADIQARGVSADYMRRRAAEIGADAVIIVFGGGKYSPEEVWASEDRQQRTYTRLLATAIKYK